MREITQLDLFCGGGGFGMASKKAGVKIVQAFDWDKYAVKQYNHNVGDHAEVANIREMNWSILKPANIWSFGFPCTDLSKARMDERKKLEGDGSGTFYEVMRLLDEIQENNATELRPDILLIENVYELGEVMDILEDELSRRGYTIKPGLYNSKWWGVPQNRPRWYVVGVDKRINKTYKPVKEHQNYTVKAKYFLEENVDDKYFYNPVKYDYVPTNAEYKQNELWQVGNIEGQKGWLESLKRVYSAESFLPGLTTCQGGHRQFKIIDPKTDIPRKGTPREYARAQGFPEEYEIIVSNAQAYKVFGNAVTVPLAAAHLENIKAFLLSL